MDLNQTIIIPRMSVEWILKGKNHLPLMEIIS